MGAVRINPELGINYYAINFRREPFGDPAGASVPVHGGRP